MKKDHKRELKEDELVSGYESAMEWLGAHRDEIRIGLVVGLVLAVGVGALTYFRDARTREAEDAYAAALIAFTAPVQSELPPNAPKPTGVSFATPKERFEGALALFDGLAKRHPGVPSAQRARYYAALCRIELGQYAEAEKALQDLVSRRTGTETDAGLARLALAGLYRRSGQVDKAADTYRQLSADAASGVPRDYALLTLGQTLEEAKRPLEARAAYVRLTEEFPASALAADAKQRADYLHPVSES